MSTIAKFLVSILLRFVDPHKPWGSRFFGAMAKFSVSIAYEAVALRKNPETGEAEVFMTRRPNNDIAYPGLLHCPGTVLRSGEKGSHALARLAQSEFGVSIKSSKFVAIVSNPREARGHFTGLIYRVELAQEPSRGGWYSISSLPSTTVSFHKNYVIPLAAGSQKFKKLFPVKVKQIGI